MCLVWVWQPVTASSRAEVISDNKRYNQCFGDIAPYIISNAFDINIHILNEANQGLVREILVTPGSNSLWSFVAHRHRDHFNGINFVQHARRKQPHLQCSADFLKAHNLNSSHIQRSIRKSLFKHRIWTPKSPPKDSSRMTTLPVDNGPSNLPDISLSPSNTVPWSWQSVSHTSTTRQPSPVRVNKDDHYNHRSINTVTTENRYVVYTQDRGANLDNLVQIKTCTCKYILPVIYHANTQSDRFKLDDLSVTAKHHQVDVKCITESWFHDNMEKGVLSNGRFLRPH